MKLLDEKEILKASKSSVDEYKININDDYSDGLSVGLKRGFVNGAKFLEQQLLPVMVEFVEWKENIGYKRCLRRDVFRWYNEDGEKSLTTYQLLDQFIEQRMMNQLENLLAFESDEERTKFINSNRTKRN